jgi:hypothetical protein
VSAHPDPALTPGDWSPTIIPRHVTFGTKLAVYRAYKIPLLRRLRYTIDHLVPLEIGGTNATTNLWPQPRREAKIKDADEDRLATEVRSKQITRHAAQAWILAKWGAR